MKAIPESHRVYLHLHPRATREDIKRELNVGESTARDYMAIREYGWGGQDNLAVVPDVDSAENTEGDTDSWIEGAVDEYLTGGHRRDIETILVIPDAHLGSRLRDADPAYRLVRRFATHLKPDTTVLLGDFGDFQSVSHWMDNKRASLEGIRFGDEIKLLNGELDYYQSVSGKVEYVEGNHEDWVNQYIEKFPSMKSLLELPVQLRLKERGVGWYPYVDNGEMLSIGKLYFSHGYWTGIHHATKHLSRFGCNIIYGHTHSSQKDTQNMRMQIPHQAYGLGCLCKLGQDYLRGAPPNWLHSFAVVYVNKKTGQFQVNEINIVDNMFIYNGELFS